MKKGEAVAGLARLSMKASANADVSDITERKDRDLMFSIRWPKTNQWSPVGIVIIKKGTKERPKDNQTDSCNRPFAQLLSGLETGHPAAAGPSPACDFSVSDEQKAVFLVSVLDCSE